MTALAWAFLGMALLNVTLQATSLFRLIGSRAVGGSDGRMARRLITTISCRVVSALAYVAVATATLLHVAPPPVVVFSLVQAMFMLNSLADVRLRRQLAPRRW